MERQNWKTASMQTRGEDVLPTHQNPLKAWFSFITHKNRYEFAYSIVDNTENDLTLDVACGTGYGSELLMNGKWYGVDIDTNAICSGNKIYRQLPDKQLFVNANGCSLPFKDGSFKSVVSLETIEHVELCDTHTFLNEIYRVLRSDGTLVISTPNRDFSNPEKTINDQPHNKNHKFEFNLKEFELLLGEQFEINGMYYQKGPVKGKNLFKIIRRKIDVVRMEFTKVRLLDTTSNLKEMASVYIAVCRKKQSI